MSRPVGLGARISRAFLVQVILIAVVAIGGVYLAAFTLEAVLIKQALEEESEHFWSVREGDAQFREPNTRNLTGYLRPGGSTEGVPWPLHGLPPGFHRTPQGEGFTAVHVSRQGGDTLYLVFDGEQVNKLAIYFGILPLSGVLVVIYVSAWIAYKLSQRAISPILRLAKTVRTLDLEHPDPEVFSPEQLSENADVEVRALADSLQRLIQRINAFVDRERNFTRDASHELRSPLTVISLAADLLMTEQELSRPAKNSVLRIKRAANDMQELCEALLMLAREADQGLPREDLDLTELAQDEIERARPLIMSKEVEVRTEFDGPLRITAPEKIVSVLVGNLIRNAFAYTDTGNVTVESSGRQLRVRDTGIGIPQEALQEVFKPFVRSTGSNRRGHGVGLSIVKRLADRFGWPLSIESSPGTGTCVTVEFPDATPVLDHPDSPGKTTPSGTVA